MKGNIFLFTIGLCCIIAFFVIPPQEYTKSRKRECWVMDKMIINNGKSSDRTVLILKELKTGKLFDLGVTLATYSQAKVGETLVFNLQESEIQQTAKGDLMIMFLGILAISGVVCTVAGSIGLIRK